MKSDLEQYAEAPAGRAELHYKSRAKKGQVQTAEALLAEQSREQKPLLRDCCGLLPGFPTGHDFHFNSKFSIFHPEN